jgi:RND family efflux transporter MFP subunit
MMVAAVAWLSGGCEDRVAPGEVALPPGEVISGGRIATVVERVEPNIVWAAGEVASARHTEVSSRVVARIEDVRARAGSAVVEGDVLVVLDARDLAAREGEAEQALRSGRAELDLARTEYERARNLLEQGVGTRQRVDQTRSARDAATARVRGLQQALEEARTALSFAQIRAPASGRVVDRFAEPGDTAMPGRPLLRIYDPALLRVEVPVRESLAIHLNVGQPLPVEIPALDKRVDGSIDEIVPFAERGARTLLVKVGLGRATTRLFAGMFARVGIPAGERRRLLVPEWAVERVGQLEFVRVAGESDVVERRMVTTGETAGGGEIEVLSGLAAGERIWITAAANPEAARARAAAVIADLKLELEAALAAALALGPEAAIQTCRVEAPRIAAKHARDGVRVGRTSHRLRNPANAPATWMQPPLDEFRNAPPKPGSSRTVDLGARGIGYIEPIYLKPVCTTCHGNAIEPALLERIRAQYPDDQAFGFEEGDFRGLFWAVIEPSVARQPSLGLIEE